MVFIESAHVLVVLRNDIIPHFVLHTFLFQRINKFSARVAFAHRLHKGLVFLITPEVVPLRAAFVVDFGRF